jgi:signal transduction histidine kinase
VPVYEAAVPQGSLWGDEIEAVDRPAGESEPRGFAGGLFRIQDLVDAALSNLRPSGIEIRLYFGESGAGEPGPDVEPFYIHRSRAPETNEQPDPGSRLRTFSDEIRVADQVWTMVGSPRPGYFESDLSSSRLILGSGIAFTLLACIYLSSVIGQARQVRRLVGQRTLELERSNAALNSEIADRERAEEALRQLNLTLEQRIEQRTAESERRARDLEQFAYVASHDLKAPLRGIANLATWLSQDLEDCLTPEVAEQLDLMRDRVARMNALIEGLLSYSRIGRDQGTDEPIDIARLIADSVDSLAPPPGFKIQVAPNMPHLQGDPLALSMVLTNLIGNAIKHHDRTEGLVRICARCIGDRCEFNVKDDGPGIPPELHDKVFLMFQTLKVKDTQGDTGIGLAIVKKLVEEHGGHISLHSGPHRGCRFRFTWPRRLQKAERAISEGSPDQGPEAR